MHLSFLDFPLLCFLWAIQARRTTCRPSYVRVWVILSFNCLSNLMAHFFDALLGQLTLFWTITLEETTPRENWLTEPNGLAHNCPVPWSQRVYSLASSRRKFIHVKSLTNTCFLAVSRINASNGFRSAWPDRQGVWLCVMLPELLNVICIVWSMRSDSWASRRPPR